MRRTFTIAAPKPRARRPDPVSQVVLTKVSADLPIRVSHDERTLAQKVNDRRFQDLIVHGDKWLGRSFFLGSFAYLAVRFFPDYDLGMISNAVFYVAIASAFWLTALGVATGVLYSTNRGKGFDTIMPGDPVNQDTASDQSAAAKPQSALPAFAGLALLFVVEATLLVLGIYLQGWWQGLLGFIGLVILTIAFIYNINEVSIRSAVSAELQTLAVQRAQEYRDLPLAPQQYKPAHKANEAKRANRRKARKHMQLAILTACDFTLAAVTFFACWAMSKDAVWVTPVTFYAFVGTAVWLMFLGDVTGHGGPGEHDHPLDVIDDEEEKKSICDLMRQLRAGTQGNTEGQPE